MAYKIVTKINDNVISSATFDGHINHPETRTINPDKASDYNSWYFIINRRPVKAKSTDVMTIEQINIDD